MDKTGPLPVVAARPRKFPTFVSRGRWAVGLLSIVTVAAQSGRPLVEAAKAQNAAGVRALLSKHVDVNAAQGDGATALHWAVHWGDREIASLLLNNGAAVNTADDNGVTPLWLACLNGSAPMVEMLLKAGAQPNTALVNGETPLMKAAQTGNPDVVNLLLRYKADVNAKETLRGQTALMRAVAENHTDVVALLISNGANVQARSKMGFTPLLFAAQQGNVDATRILLAAGSDVNEAAPDGIAGDTNARVLFRPNTQAAALLVAIDSGHEKMADFLLDRGADPNQHGAGRTPLHSAVQQSMPDLVKSLLAHGANPNARLEKPMPLLSRYIGAQAGLDVDAIGATPFWLAADYLDTRMMQVLADGGADPLLTSKDGTTPLMVAAGLDFIEGQNKYGRRWFQDTTVPLQLAAIEAVKLALKLGGDVNAVNANGQTALHGAAYLGGTAMAQFLADRGARLDAVNRLGQTPYYITQGIYQAGSFLVRKDTGELLRKLGADIRLGAELSHNKPAEPQK